jgi:hypothetical protein
VRRHDLDVVSLLAGLVFVTLGGTGLLQSADVIGTGLAWPLIGAVAAVGVTGLVVTLGRLVGSPDAPATEADTCTQAETIDTDTIDDQADTYTGADAGASASTDEHTGPGSVAPPLGFDAGGETIDEGARGEV